jgi:hypothetical protein
MEKLKELEALDQKGLNTIIHLHNDQIAAYRIEIVYESLLTNFSLQTVIIITMMISLLTESNFCMINVCMMYFLVELVVL